MSYIDDDLWARADAARARINEQRRKLQDDPIGTDWPLITAEWELTKRMRATTGPREDGTAEELAELPVEYNLRKAQIFATISVAKAIYAVARAVNRVAFAIEDKAVG